MIITNAYKFNSLTEFYYYDFFKAHLIVLQIKDKHFVNNI
jgi:hypothetical protein